MKILHLAEISARVAPGAHAILMLDVAGLHRPGGRLRVPGNITLLRLPSYAPELNPIENIRAFLRSNKLSKRVFTDYDYIVSARADAWSWLTNQPERITSIASRPWTQIIQ